MASENSSHHHIDKMLINCSGTVRMYIRHIIVLNILLQVSEMLSYLAGVVFLMSSAQSLNRNKTFIVRNIVKIKTTSSCPRLNCFYSLTYSHFSHLSCEVQHIKRIVHLKIHSLSSHHYADGGAGEVFKSTKHFWSLRGKLG